VGRRPLPGYPQNFLILSGKINGIGSSSQDFSAGAGREETPGLCPDQVSIAYARSGGLD